MRTAGARRFAQAAFELATRDGKVDEWQRDLAFGAQIASDEKAGAVIDSRAIPIDRRRELVRGALGSRIGELPLKLVLVLTERNRFSLLPQIASEYDRLVRQSRGIVQATVWTPRPLPAADVKALRERIEQLAGATVELETAADPQLIGGLRVRIGDLSIDASVSGRLARLRRQLVTETT